MPTLRDIRLASEQLQAMESFVASLEATGVAVAEAKEEEVLLNLFGPEAAAVCFATFEEAAALGVAMAANIALMKGGLDQITGPTPQ